MMVNRVNSRLSTVFYFQLGEDIGDMGLNRLKGNDQFLGNGLIGVALTY